MLLSGAHVTWLIGVLLSSFASASAIRIHTPLEAVPVQQYKRSEGAGSRGHATSSTPERKTYAWAVFNRASSHAETERLKMEMGKDFLGIASLGDPIRFYIEG